MSDQPISRSADLPVKQLGYHKTLDHCCSSLLMYFNTACIKMIYYSFTFLSFVVTCKIIVCVWCLLLYYKETCISSENNIFYLVRLVLFIKYTVKKGNEIIILSRAVQHYIVYLFHFWWWDCRRKFLNWKLIFSY